MKKVMWEQIPDRRSIASFLKRRKGMCILILLYLLCLVFVKNDAWFYRIKKRFLYVVLNFTILSISFSISSIDT